MNRMISLLMGQVVLACCICQLVPFTYSIAAEAESATIAFGGSILISLLIGICLVGYGKTDEERLSLLSGASFLFVCWWVMAVFGALPYWFHGDLSFLSAMFQGVSCFTTTGVSELPPYADASIVLWRSMSQWIGGFMVLQLLSTIVPGTGGYFGIAYVMPGNMRTGAITMKRIHSTSVKILRIYSVATLVGIIMYLLCGLPIYDAVNMALVTISTGGCYNSVVPIELNGWVFLTAFFGVLTAGCNILLYWQAVDHRELRIIQQTWHNSETRIFMLMIAGCTILIGGHLYQSDCYDSLGECIANAMFQVVSFGCTTGIMAERAYSWSDMDKFFLVGLSLVGGCIGSLAGGFKIFRLQVLLKSSLAELKRTLHPNMVVRIGVDGKAVPQEVIERILGFFFMYFMTLLISLLIISLSGLNMQQTLDVAIACLTSAGPMMFFHVTHEELRQLPELIKVYCCLLMIVGKINTFTFLLIIHGAWSRLAQSRW